MATEFQRTCVALILLTTAIAFPLSCEAASAGIFPQPPLKACSKIDPGEPFIEFERQLVRAGDRIRIRPMVSHAWFGSEEVRWDCWRDWRVSDPKYAQIDRKHGVLSVNRKMEGGPIKVSATFRKTPFIAQSLASVTVKILGRAEQVLEGTWSEFSRENCEGEPIGELIFKSSGSYSFTYSGSMIETMTSGGGTYKWDAATSVLQISGAGGATRKGAAKLGHWKNTNGGEPGALVIAGIDFYPQPPSASPKLCRLIFQRVK